MIDLHAHVVLDATLGAAGEWGPVLDEGVPGCEPSFRVGAYVLEGVRYRGTPFMDVDARLDAMDARGIDLAVLSPNPLTFLAHVDTPTAVAFSRLHNDALAAFIEPHPTRLAGFAQLPTQEPGAAVDELYRAVRNLGLVGAYIATDLGRPLDDAGFDPLYAACVDLNVPLFLHPTPDGVDRPARDERLGRFDAGLWLGFAQEEALAVATLILGGVLSRHPAVDICISHGGGSTHVLAERMAHAARTRPWSSDDLRAEGTVEALLSRLWWDGHVAGPIAMRALIDSVGDTRIVGGTNFAGWDDLADEPAGPDRVAVFDANARRLLRRGT